MECNTMLTCMVALIGFDIGIKLIMRVLYVALEREWDSASVYVVLRTHSINITRKAKHLKVST